MATDLSALTLWLGDGRRMGYADYGDRSGRPAFFFHGAPGSRLSAALLDEQARDAGVRLIALDRPGFGLSSPQPGRDRAEWADDVAEVADHLGLDRFLVVGWSAGGPYALAAAAFLPERVSAVGVIAGVDRLQHLHPQLLRNLWSLRVSFGDADRWSDRLARAWLRTKKVAGSGVEATQASAGTLARGIRESLRDGPSGVFHELRLLGSEWNFDPSRIRNVPVRFWHGLDDAVISTKHTREQCARIPGAQATYLPNCGHVTLMTVHGREILNELTRLAT
ncbi:MAG: alpha/beta hydrolase [Propionibacteriaceae bacterium]|nr:alpha/beta hydrolase [Propionibacteriaceae bacterium]